MRVLITGGAGFIGSHLADRLIARQDSVTIIDNLATGRLDNIPKEAKFYNESIVNYAKLQDIFVANQPEIVVHAAASYRNPDDFDSDILTNCLGTSNLVQLVKAHKKTIKRVIYFQTSCAYLHGDPNIPLTPDTPLVPENSSYAITKTTAEHFIKLCEVPYISFRLANTASARSLTGPIPTFYKRLSQGQKCFVTDTRRDFINIKDLCSVVIRAIDGEGHTGAYNISTGKDYAIKDLYNLVAKEMGVTLEPELRARGEDDTYTLLIDPSKTEQDFPGWRADTPIEQTVKEVIGWCKTHTIDQTYTHLRMKK